jgi:hypothetical protein
VVDGVGLAESASAGGGVVAAAAAAAPRYTFRDGEWYRDGVVVEYSSQVAAAKAKAARAAKAAARASNVAAASAALHSAARKGKGAVVEQLLAAGADVNVVDSEGRTALHYAGGDGKSKGKGVVVEKLQAGARTQWLRGCWQGELTRMRPTMTVRRRCIGLQAREQTWQCKCCWLLAAGIWPTRVVKRHCMLPSSNIQPRWQL